MAVFGKESSNPQQIINELVKRVNENSRRLRELEENIRTLETKISSLQDDFLDNKDKNKDNFEDLEENIKDLNTRVMKIENEAKRLNKRLDKTVTTSEFDEVENFIDLISPLNSKFTTENQVREMIREEMKKING
ncbi:MAG: hypothetical protein ABEK36_00380 [Candidatus Aenigmatarchaeota archaeon]